MAGEKKQYVWYVGYGSNLCEERFLCYIRGGKFKWGGSLANGCKDKTPPGKAGLFGSPIGYTLLKNLSTGEMEGLLSSTPIENPMRTIGLLAECEK